MNELFLSLFHLLFNTFFIFFILAVSIECVLFIFRIKNARVRTFFRLFPLVKIILDIALYKLPFGFFFNLNPFGCKKYLNKCVLDAFSLHNFDSPSVGLIFICATLLLSLFFFGRKLYQILLSQKYLSSIIHFSKSCERTIHNPLLKIKVDRLRAKVVVSEKTLIPFATASSYIVLPKKLLDTLTQEEFEAIIAHELEHLRWRDPLIKMCSSLISALFWWIPLNWWLKRLERDQEEACDHGIGSYGIQAFSLATGIVKTVRKARASTSPTLFVCQIVQLKNIQVERLEKLLSGDLPQHKSKFAHALIAGTLSAIPFFTIWIC